MCAVWHMPMFTGHNRHCLAHTCRTVWPDIPTLGCGIYHSNHDGVLWRLHISLGCVTQYMHRHGDFHELRMKPWRSCKVWDLGCHVQSWGTQDACTIWCSIGKVEHFITLTTFDGMSVANCLIEISKRGKCFWCSHRLKIEPVWQLNSKSSYWIPSSPCVNLQPHWPGNMTLYKYFEQQT